MSTNKTTSYGLHLWEPTDDFLRTEFNENFAALDEAVAAAWGKIRVVSGMYEGDRKSDQVIATPFRPKAVLVYCKASPYYLYHALYLDGQENGYGAITEEGFSVKGHLNHLPVNADGTNGTTMNPYHYLALWWAE